jgi:hypothetical protein
MAIQTNLFEISFASKSDRPVRFPKAPQSKWLFESLVRSASFEFDYMSTGGTKKNQTQPSTTSSPPTVTTTNTTPPPKKSAADKASAAATKRAMQDGKVRQIKNGVAEIKPHNDRGIAGAKRQLNQPDRDRLKGSKSVVTYEKDPQNPNKAIVRMAQVNKYGETVGWVEVGRVDIAPNEQNLSNAQLGTKIESRVRDLVNEKTGGNVTNVGKDGNATGPDIVFGNQEFHEFEWQNLNSNSRDFWLFENPYIILEADWLPRKSANQYAEYIDNYRDPVEPTESERRKQSLADAGKNLLKAQRALQTIVSEYDREKNPLQNQIQKLEKFTPTISKAKYGLALLAISQGKGTSADRATVQKYKDEQETIKGNKLLIPKLQKKLNNTHSAFKPKVVAAEQAVNKAQAVFDSIQGMKG